MSLNAAENAPELEEDPQQQQVPEGGTVVNIEPDDDEDDGQEGQVAGAPDPNTLDRRGRRNFVRTIKTENENLKRELAELRGRMDQVALHQQAPQRQEPPPSRQVDPVRAAMADTRQQMQYIARLLSSKETPAADLERLQQQYMDLDERRIILAARAVQPQQQAQRGPSYEEQAIRAEYPEVFARQDLFYEASAEYERLKAANRGQDGGLPMIRAAIERTLTRHGMRQKRLPPNPSLQAKLGGTPARAGASGGGGNSVVLDKGQRRTAISYYDNTPFSHLSDDERIRKWTKEIWLKPERQ